MIMDMLKSFSQVFVPLVSASVLFVSTFTLATADEVETVHLGKSKVTKEQVVDLLSPSKPVYKTRGLRLHKAETQSQAPEQAGGPRALSLEVYFEFNSAELSSEAMAQLAPVGEALQAKELETLSFTFEGHTDASGSDAYNLSLSERRAQSVKDFFIQSYRLEPSRVNSVGRGESQLIEGVDANSPVNRRVAIIAE